MMILTEAAASQVAHPASLVPLLTRKSIRVFHLHPSIGTARVSGTLNVINLDDALRVAYDAISYTWGPEPTPACPALPITINGHVVLIRQSLHDCLLRLRLQDVPRILWIDFLCIDQERLDEKARQVTMIGEVFRGADTVRVWVGEHDGGSEMLFRGWPKEQKTHANIASSLVKELDRVLLRRSQLTRDESKRRADVWMRFFNRSYWGRTWICQEIYQARIIVVHCGEDEMGWGQLIASRFESESCFDGISLRAALNVPESAQLGYNVIGKIRELNVNRRGASGSAVIGSFHDKDVLFFTQHFSHSWATIPHDKVWAFVSMEGSKYEDDPLSVSYEISLPDLLLSLYEQRLVLWDEKLGFTKWRRRLPDLDLVIESLRLGQDQRLEVLRRLVDRVTKTTEEPYRQRWEHLLTRQEFANDRIWRRDRKVNGSGNVKYTRDWQWENSSWAPMPTQREKLPRDLDDNAPAPVRSSRTARIVRLRFNGDQYYVRMPLPFNRRSTGG